MPPTLDDRTRALGRRYAFASKRATRIARLIATAPPLTSTQVAVLRDALDRHPRLADAGTDTARRSA